MKIAPAILITSLWIAASGQTLGPFEDHTDVGTVLQAGSVQYDEGTNRFTISSAGENMWARADDFHFVWKKVSGDVRLTAAIAFPKPGGNAHRKAVLMIRQSLDTDSEYVDAAMHGDGLTSLQSRDAKGGTTREVGTNAAAPDRLRLEKRGEYFYMFYARGDQPLRLAGGSMRLALKAPFYVGVGVCAHDKNAVETAVFSDVEVKALPEASGKLKLYSTLETVAVSSTDRRVAYVTEGRLESPGWSADGKALLFNEAGRGRRVSDGGGFPEDSALLETDDSVSSPDGKHTYFSSSSHIWRRNADGSGQEQVTSADDWEFAPRLSPDGQRLLFLSAAVAPAKDTDIVMRVMNLADGKIAVLAKLIGGSGTLGSPAWSPDGKRVTFVSYQYLPE